MEQEAIDALAEVKSGLSETKLAEAEQMLKEGRETLNIVRYGNGVHNKKYSIMLIDAAITRFEDVLDFIEESEQHINFFIANPKQKGGNYERKC